MLDTLYARWVMPGVRFLQLTNVEMRHRIILVSCLILWGVFSNAGVFGQEKIIPTLNLEDYHKILDRLFPRDVLDEQKYGRSFHLVLRYKPSFDAESQIVIAGHEDGINVVEFTSLDGDTYYKLTEVMGRTGQESSVDLARYIRVRRRELKVPVRRLNTWRKNLLAALSKAFQTKVQESASPKARREIQVESDGTTYELWDSSLSGEIYFTQSDLEESGRDFTGKRAFIGWMERIRQEVAGSR